MSVKPRPGANAVSRETIQRELATGLAELGLCPTPLAEQRLIDYLDLLIKWNRVYNLTAVRDPLEMIKLHVLDSLSVLSPIENVLDTCAEPHLLDIGAGAGLPGIVLAIMRPDWQITLCDAVQKKVAFMTQAIGQLKLKNAQARHGRVELLALSDAVDAAVSRAFSDIDLFASLAKPHLKPGGLLLAMQGKAQDRCPSGFKKRDLHAVTVPGLLADRHLLILESLKG